MADINKARTQYQIYIDRYTASSHTPNQAEYYKACQDINNQSSTVEESARKIKASNLYTAGGTAVTLDKVQAQLDAAKETDMPEVVRICEEKLEKLKADPMSAYTTSSHWTEISNVKNKYLNTIEAFIGLFGSYIEYLTISGVDSSDKVRLNGVYQHIRNNLNKLSLPTNSFTELVKMPKFRAILNCSDTCYNEFISFIQAAAVQDIKPIKMDLNFDKEIQDGFAELQAKAPAMQDKAKEIVSRPSAPPCACISPNDENGDYQFINLGGDR